jgi:mono/diheme cytochrome c family protein
MGSSLIPINPDRLPLVLSCADQSAKSTMDAKAVLIAGALGTVLMASLTAGCEGGLKSGKGLHLAEGDADRGKTAFLELGCNRCHSVSGVELPAYPGDTPIRFELGGAVRKVRTYGDLLTSITNPRHVVSPEYLHTLPPQEREAAGAQTPMPSLNDRMTVAQLLDLVALLHGQYTLKLPEYTGYGLY